MGFPELFENTIGSIHFIPGIYPYGVSLLTPSDSPTVWPLYAFLFVLLQFYVPFYVKNKKKMIILCAFLEFECAKRLKVHSRAISGPLYILFT